MNETKSCPCEHVLRLQEKVEEQQKDIAKLYTREGETGVRLQNIEKSNERIEKKLDDIAGKPAKRWETVVTETLKIIIAVVLGFVFAYLGLK